jgi:uncharacterized RDD family membrane protein YckC
LLAHLAFSAIAFVTKPRAFEWPNPGPLVLATLWWVLLVLYLTIMWSVSGRTLGDQVMGLRVLTLGGDRLHGVRAFLRAIVCAVFPLGLLWCAVDRRRRGVHDLIVRTQVVYDWIPHGETTTEGT